MPLPYMKSEPGESVESFITAVHTLAEHCDFGALREELIRDRIVVGIGDAKLSESLQLSRLNIRKSYHESETECCSEKTTTSAERDRANIWTC